MGRSVDQSEALEQRAVAAQRAYLAALLAWERTTHRMGCPICGPAGMVANERARICAAAEAEKESRRILFRDLCDQLGFIPTGHGVALAKEEACWWRASTTSQ